VNALLVDTMAKAGARAIVVDILHLDRGAGPEDAPPEASADGSADGSAEDGDDAHERRQTRLALEQMMAESYREALRSSARSIVGFELSAAARYDLPARRTAAEAALPDLSGAPLEGGLTRTYASLPVLRVAEGATLLGFTNTLNDEDGVVRRMHALGRWDERTVPSLALSAAALAAGSRPRRTPEGVAWGDVTRRLAPDGGFHVPLARPGDRSPFARVAMRDLVAWAQDLDPEGNVPQAARDALEGRVVVFGVNLAGQKDVVATAAGEIPGPEFQAHTLLALMTGRQRIAVARWVDVALTLGAGLLLGLLLGGLRSRTGSLVAVAGLLLLSQAVPAWLHPRGVVLTAAAPAMALGLTGLGWLALNLLLRSRANRWLQGTFGRYLAPSVIQALSRDPSLIRLGGRRRTLTILFSDLAGFTKMARKLTPDQVVELLNRYLTMHAGAVLAEGGVVDKFIGDAVMAFWGDPVEQPDQAVRACRTALAVIEGMPEVEAFAKGMGLEGFRVRIGIQTGPAVVGNMGSQDRQDYTCMGDTVNLASRLEGVNKAFGTTCLLGDATFQAAREHIVARHIGDVVVVGYDEAVPVHELLGRAGDAVATARAQDFAAAAAALREDRLDVARARLQALVAAHPDDGAARWLAGVLAALEAGTLPRPWTGRVVLDAK
jgi:adenylate cyclase